MKNDRVPRTLNEAFGPYAELDDGSNDYEGPTPVGFILSILIALAIGGVSWLIQH